MAKKLLQGAVLAIGLSSVAADATRPIDVGSRMELLLDDWLVAEAGGSSLEVTPAAADHRRLIAPDAPGDAHGVWPWSSVLEEGGRLRLWYGAYPAGETKERGGTCYAESRDGLHWVKPSCGVTDLGGRRDNNVVLTMQHPGTVFLDPAAPADARYKAIFGERDAAQGYGHKMTIPDGERVFDWLGPTVEGAVSPDGIHWTKTGRLMDWYTDTGNVAFYDPRIRRYVAYVRDNQYPRFPGGAIRCIARTESATFGSFPAPVRVLAPDKEDPPGVDLYNPAAHVYPFADSLYLMFPSVFDHASDTLRVGIATSRDGVRWERRARGFLLEPGADGAFDSRQVYLCVGMIPRGDEIWMYYGGFAFPHGKSKPGPGVGGIGRIVLRRGRFIARVAGAAPARLRTKPLVFAGGELRVNADCGAGGELRVEVQDESGSPIPGFRAADCAPIRGDATDRPVRWRGAGKLSALGGKPVRLEFTFQRTRLYGFQFGAR
jgi:hypothetical protein